jgi:hypothetical protein
MRPKTDEWDCMKKKKKEALLHGKGNHHNNSETTYRMGENLSQLFI